MSCPVGKIRRVSYTRKNGTKVASGCTKDQGAPGKGKKVLPKPRSSGALTSLGYSVSGTTSDRRKALKKAVKKYGGLSIIRRINLIRNYSKNMKDKHKRYTSDLEYVQKLYKESKLK